MSGDMDDPFVVAGEYVLGTLDHAEQLYASARLTRDPAFADAVAFWEHRLTPLCGLVTPVAPPAILWSRLALASGVRDNPAGANNRFWQGSTAAALSVAAGLAIFAFLPAIRAPAPSAPHFAAALAPLNVTVPFMADAGADGRLVVTWLPGFTTPSGRSYQLWEIPTGAAQPTSLGVLVPGRAIVLPSGSASPSQAKLLVSEEPSGGSTTGQPTGPVLFGGTLTQVPQPDR